MKFQLLLKSKMLKYIRFLFSKLSDAAFIMLKNVGILTFMSMINFMLSIVELEISFITSKTGHILSKMRPDPTC